MEAGGGILKVLNAIYAKKKKIVDTLDNPGMTKISSVDFGVFCMCVNFLRQGLDGCNFLCRTRPGWPPKSWDQKYKYFDPIFLLIFSCGIFTFSSKKQI